jgi:hypothetical protein
MFEKSDINSAISGKKYLYYCFNDKEYVPIMVAIAVGNFRKGPACIALDVHLRSLFHKAKLDIE